MASDEDIYTRRPRTPNDQYSVMTEEQIRNIQKTAHPFFKDPITRPWPPTVGLPREGGRYYLNRYCHLHNGGNARNMERTSSILYVDEQIRPNDVPIEHDSCRGMASAKWGPQKLGSRTRSHFFGEPVESFTTIDMYRRPATTYTGRVVMDCGRPGDGYYTQRFPDRSSWNQSTAKLNCTNVMDSVYRKTFDDYKQVREAEQTARQYRKNEWPEMSEYTDRYLLRSRIPAMPSRIERNKQHGALGRQLRAAEIAMETEKREQAIRMRPPQTTRDPTVVTV